MRFVAFIFALFVAGTVAGGEQPPCTPFTLADQIAARNFWNQEDRKHNATPVMLPGLFDRPLGLLPMMTKRAFSAFVTSAPPAAKIDPPFDAAGKLLVATKTGITGNFCTASFIDTDVVMTAAHCICPSFCYDTILFTRVFGTGEDEDFDIAAWTVSDEWLTLHEPGRFLFDIAFLSTADKLKNVTSIGVDPTIAPTCIAAGYPYTINLGAAMDSAEGSAAFDSASGMILMQNNDLGEGSSGGPWTPSNNHIASGTLFSVGSRIGPSDTSLLGPVLDLTLIKNLLTRLRGNCAP